MDRTSVFLVHRKSRHQHSLSSRSISFKVSGLLINDLHLTTEWFFWKDMVIFRQLLLFSRVLQTMAHRAKTRHLWTHLQPAILNVSWIVVLLLRFTKLRWDQLRNTLNFYFPLFTFLKPVSLTWKSLFIWYREHVPLWKSRFFPIFDRRGIVLKLRKTFHFWVTIVYILFLMKSPLFKTLSET